MANTTQLKVTGMDCNGCVRHVTDAILSVPGVDSTLVQLESGQAQVRWKPGASADSHAVVRAIHAAGYSATPSDRATLSATTTDASPFSGWGVNLLLGVPVTAFLMAGDWIFRWHGEAWFNWLAFALATLIQGIGGARFYRGAWRQLRAGSSNMDTLVALGSTTAYAYSVWALLTRHTDHLYFMESASIITLISVGHWLEGRVSVRAAGALRALMNLTPPTARRVDDAGKETVVPVSQLQTGDRVVLRPGDRVPVDGSVIEGRSSFDESMLTGESLPVEKEIHDKLYAGTTNSDGSVVLRVDATGEATALANIIAVVQRAQSSRAEIQRLGDRVSSVFVPIVILIAIATGLWWGLAPESARAVSEALGTWLWPVTIPDSRLASAVVHAAAVLIIACPCAMGLATPVAIMAGTNAAARLGILIRDGKALEASGTINAVMFDKTGTLTEGHVKVDAVWDLRPDEKRTISLMNLAAGLAGRSNHPLARAIAEHKTRSEAAAAAGEPPQFEQWREVRGAGTTGHLDGHEHRLGSLPWLEESGVPLADAGSFPKEWADCGATVLGVASGGRLLGAIAVRDTIKPDAPLVVADLMDDGTRCYLVTGDNPRAAAAIAEAAGFPPEDVFSEVRPAEKAKLIADLQQRGLRVAFVGDGINDAPALEQADLGIAVSRASDVAREAADVILLNSDIHAVPEALALARATLRTIKQNLFWAFFYNAAGIPLAALGFLSPVLCAAAMGFSDLIVIGNALRLHRWKR